MNWESDPNHGIGSHVVVPVAQLSTKHADPMKTIVKHKFSLDCFTSVVEFVYLNQNFAKLFTFTQKHFAVALKENKTFVDS